MRKAAARFFWALANHPTDPRRPKRRAFSTNKGGHHKNRNQPVLVTRNILRAGDSHRGLGEGEEIAMMTIDVQPENFLVRVLYMQGSRPRKK
jgi:hypothetical protein